MRLLPNLERAVIRIEKLRDYALNMDHPHGKHKAVVFRDMLGIARRHAEVLADLLGSTLPSAAAEHVKRDEHGDRWLTHHDLTGINGQSAIVTVAWIFKKEQSSVPELISCYIQPRKQKELRNLLDRPETHER